jgi:hypothetical protein
MATLTSSPAIGYSNLADGATITASSAAAGFPGSRLSNALLSSSWRSANAALTGVTVDVDLGSARDFDVAALVGVNFQDGHTRRWRNGESSTFASHEHESGGAAAAGFDTTYPALLDDAPSSGRNLIYCPGTTQNSRYGRFDLNDSGNPDNYLKSSVYWVGPVWQSTIGMDPASEPLEVWSGSPGVERCLRGWAITWNWLTEAESRALLSVLRSKLRTGRYLVVPRPTTAATFLNEALYCTVLESPRRQIQPTVPLSWSVTVSFVEVED